MDEVGLSVRHSNTPNVRCCPVLVIQADSSQPSYALSLMWAVLDVKTADVIERDFLHGVPKGNRLSFIAPLPSTLAANLEPLCV